VNPARTLRRANGLPVSEACATNVEDLGLECGHRTLGILGKGNKPAMIPLVPRTARTIDLAVGERREGPILLRRDGQRLDRRTAHRWVRSIGKRAGLGPVHPHMLRAAFIMAALDALLIEELSVDEDEAFATALDS
jgi:integrase/recombinase XerD